jgi:hypothetical protein
MSLSYLKTPKSTKGVRLKPLHLHALKQKRPSQKDGRFALWVVEQHRAMEVQHLLRINHL